MAQADYYLQIDGIEGESETKGHAKKIDIESFSFGAVQASVGDYAGGHGAGKVTLQDFHFTTRVSKASPKLHLACCEGTHIKSAVFMACKSGGKQEIYYTVKMADLFVSSYQIGGANGANALPVDQASLNYSKIEIEYKPQNADGKLGSPVNTGYDSKRGQKV